MVDTLERRDRAPRRGGPLGAALGLAGAWLVLLAAAAGAQLIEAWSVGTGFDPRPRIPAARLEAMGGMRVAVPDENNEIELLDFAGNLVGHLDDKPGGHVDGHGGWRGWVDRTTPAAPDQDYRSYPGGFLANARPGPRYALGGSAGYAKGAAERLISRDFLPLFALPVENPVSGSNLGSIARADLLDGDFTAHYARRLDDRLAFGLEGGYAIQTESRATATIYEIDHDSHAWSARASVAGRLVESAGPFSDWVLGANGEAADTRIDGLSADDVHTDVYTWDRIAYGLNVHLLGRVYEWVKGGIDFRYGTFEGRERAKFNWSPQFALNPTTQPIVLERSTLDEGFRSHGIATRWEARPPGLPASFGLGFRAGQSENWMLPGRNVNSFFTARSQRVTAWEGTAGGSYFLPRGRGLAAGEVSWGFSDRDERISPPTVRVGASRLELGAGGEYAVVVPFVARGGYRYIREDENRDLENPEGEFTTHRMALGAGYRIPSGRILIDLAFNYDWVSAEAEKAGLAGRVVEDKDRKSLTLQVRSLF